MSEEKRKSKGTPGRSRQNILFMLGGLVIGMMITAGAFWIISRQTVPPPTSLIQPATIAPLPPFVPTVPSTLGAPNFVPQPTVIAKRLSGLGLAPDGRRMVVAGWDNGMAIARLIEFAVSANLSGQEQVLALPNAVFSNLVFSPDSTLLAGTDDSYNTWLYRLSSDIHAPLTEIEHFMGYNSVAFSPDGQWLALGGSSGLRLIDLNTMTLVHSLQVAGAITTLAYSADNQWLAYGLVDGAQPAQLLVVNAADPTQTRYQLHSGSYVWDVAFHPDGTALVAAIDNVVQAFDLVIGGGYGFSLPELGRVRSVAFNPQGTWLAAGGGETGAGMMGSIYTWQWSPTMTVDTSVWNNYRVLSGHAHDVTQVVFQPDGAYLLSASHDGSVRLWDYLNTGYEISRLQL